MSRASSPFRNRVGILILLALLAGGWTSAGQSQEPQSETEMARFLEQRIREPGSFPHYRADSSRGSSVSQSAYLLDDLFKLAFASYRDTVWEVYISEGDGANPVRLTDYPTVDSNPRLNRGVTEIIFRSGRDGNSEIYRMNADGSDQTRLTTTGADEYHPNWSADSTRIAFSSYRDGNSEIYVMNADGSDQIRLTTHPAWDGQPAWSPDSDRIVFVSQRGGEYELWMMNADGSNQQQLTSGMGLFAYPQWSPDGKQIACNDDFNGDGWADLAILNADGTGLTHPLGPSPVFYDYLAPVWAPHAQDLAFTKVQWIEDQGNWYWVEANIDGLDLTSNTSYPLVDSGYDWWPSWQSTDASPPSSQVSVLPPWSEETFNVHWSGMDEGPAGVQSYDVQVRDGAGGAWTDWLLDTVQTSASFTGEIGHTYYFRCRARDHAGNLEPYPSGDGDTFTQIYGYKLPGHVLGNREQPLALATVESLPPAMNMAISDQSGSFALYFEQSGIYDLEASHPGFGALPPMLGVVVSETLQPVTFYLPPADDRIIDGGFEAGDLVAWNPAGPSTPTLTTTGHTGEFAVLFGGGTGTLEQEITLPSAPYSGTLSLLYRVEGVDPATNSLQIVFGSPALTVTHALPLTPTGWVHWWWDLPPWEDPAATLRVLWTPGDARVPMGVWVDEISLGTTATASYAVYIPLVTRASP